MGELPKSQLPATSYQLPNQSGQALLLVLLSMAVVLTVVLSVVTRSVTDISITSREEEALRAFSAAEAGVERALIIGSDVSGPAGDAAFTAKVTGTLTSAKKFSYPTGLAAGESQVVWFINHDASGNPLCSGSNPCFSGNKFKVCWGAAGTPSDSATTPAVEISIFYTTTPGDYKTARIARETVDPNSGRRGQNNFSAPEAGTCQIGNDSFAFQKILDLGSLGISSSVYNSQNGLQFARIKLFYNTDTAHNVGVDVDFAGNALLPPQGLKIESTGTAGESTRKVDVFEGYAETPPIFDSVLFSPGGITK